MEPIARVSPKPDPLIDEVRRLKIAASERLGDDLRRIAEHLREIERARGGAIPPPKDAGDGKVA